MHRRTCLQLDCTCLLRWLWRWRLNAGKVARGDGAGRVQVAVVELFSVQDALAQQRIHYLLQPHLQE